MKHYKILFLSLLLPSPLLAQTQLQPSYTNLNWGANNASIVAVDLDNDGARDLVFGGVSSFTNNIAGVQEWERNRMTHAAIFNKTTKRWRIKGFTNTRAFDLNQVLNTADRPAIIPCDINQDGIMDIVAFESSGVNYTDEPTLDHISQEGIFLGNGDGTFRHADITLIDDSPEDMRISEEDILSADVADFNNDGLLDIACVGFARESGRSVSQYKEANVILFNEGGGKFRVSHYLTDDYVKDYGQNQKPYHLESAEVYVYDYNNDGYTDFLVCGTSQDAHALGVRVGANTQVTELYLNDPEHPGQFKKQNIYNNNVLPTIQDGGAAIADFNNDGVPDIFLSGWTGNGHVNYVWNVYTGELGEDGSLTYKNGGHNGVYQMVNGNSTNTQYSAYDWNGDGNYDLILQGSSPSVNTETGYVFTGNGGGTNGRLRFQRLSRVIGGTGAATALTDWDGDGVNDYIMIGQTSDTTFVKGSTGATRVFAATLNTNAKPARPDAPTLNDAVVDGNKVTLSWTDAESSKKNVTYEYYVKDANGRIVAGGNSFVGGDNDGVRKVSAPGNAYNSRKVILYLPAGSYTYGVQTINASLEGSTFNNGNFNISATDVAEKDPNLPLRKDDGYIPDNVTRTNNPVLKQDAPDPSWILGPDGTFYLYSTGWSIVNHGSNDLCSWWTVGNSFTAEDRPNWGNPGYGMWAPCINYINGQYVMYYACSSPASIGVAVAKKPDDLFKAPAGTNGCMFTSDQIGVPNSIDPCYIEADGHKYMFWGSFMGLDAIELSDDGLSIKPGAQKVEIVKYNGFWDEQHSTEGSYVIKHGDYYYYIGSVGSCCIGANSNYHLVMARSKNVLGPYYDKLGRPLYDMNYSNLLYGSDRVIGPGHNAEWFEDADGQWWIIYHGYESANPDAGRQVYLDRIYWDKDGWPFMHNAQPSFIIPKPNVSKLTGINAVMKAEEKAGAEQGVSISNINGNSLKIDVTDDRPFSYTVADVNGYKWMDGKAKGNVALNTSDLPWGLFVVNVKGNKLNYSKKVIKQAN